MVYYSQDVANETGMTTEGLRYYEKKGLVRFDKDSKNGYRTYPIMQVPLLRMVKILNAYGVSLSEVDSLIHRGEDQPEAVLDVLREKCREMEQRVWREQRVLERLKEHEAIIQRVVENPQHLWFIRQEEMCYLEYYGAERLRADRGLRTELGRWLAQIPIAYPMPVLHREALSEEKPYCPAGVMVKREDMERLGLQEGRYTRRIPGGQFLCSISVQREKERIRAKEAAAPLLEAIDKMNLQLTGDIFFMSVVAAEPSPAQTLICYQVMAPVEAKDHADLI